MGPESASGPLSSWGFLFAAEELRQFMCPLGPEKDFLSVWGSGALLSVVRTLGLVPALVLCPTQGSTLALQSPSMTSQVAVPSSAL